MVGIVLWELCTRVVRGEYQRPFAEYPQITKDFQIIVLVARENLRPSIPDEVPNDMANLIEQCWQQDPDLRPSCSVLLDTLLILQEEFNRKQSW